MKQSCIKFRAMNVGGLFEIKLPNEKVILIDPWFTDIDGSDYPFPEGHSRDDIERVDYIFLTHSHYDHDSDIPYFVKKFDCPVFCGALTAGELLKHYKLPYDNVFPIYPGESFTNEDFSILARSGKHNHSGERTFLPIPPAGGPERAELHHLGSLNEYDLMITTKNNFRILISGGRPENEELFDFCKKSGPNLLLRQACVRGEKNKDGKREPISAQKLAELLCRYRSQLVIPFHHDILVKLWGQEKTDEYFKEVKEYMSSITSGTSLFYPEAWKWYSLSIGIESCEG